MEPVTDNKAGFGNNFTTVDNKSTAQNVEGIIVSAMFKSLITRCASTTHELHSPENLVRSSPLLPTGVLGLHSKTSSRPWPWEGQIEV